MSITRINEFEAAPGKADELHTFLGTIIPYITSSQGCLTCEILRNVEKPDTFVVIEQRETIDAHKASVASFPKEEMQAAMHLFGSPPKGNYYQS